MLSGVHMHMWWRSSRILLPVCCRHASSELRETLVEIRSAAAGIDDSTLRSRVLTISPFTT